MGYSNVSIGQLVSSFRADIVHDIGFNGGEDEDGPDDQHNGQNCDGSHCLPLHAISVALYVSYMLHVERVSVHDGVNSHIGVQVWESMGCNCLIF